ncbi:hypothetical protein LLEC1_07358 [Akanthomyces lecanii]|uniref:Uncharacterized protein n=1 Tax=Cordyceps confragosa TaxID=2714763 RepID=A0A179IAZ8_CORDF|nr:hypothetical protein LLEC1_07358 [Akanthomyces lecanii]
MPAPGADAPLQERLLALAQTLHHLTLIVTTIRYSFSWLRMNYYGGMAVFCYRTSFVAAALTYGIVVYKTQKARAKTGTQMSGGVVGLLADENIQYLLMALVWLIAPQYPLALIPYCVYSTFNAATYVRANLLPEYYDSSMSVVSGLEILLWFRIVLSAILFQRRSWILLGLYTVFLRGRYAQNSHVQTAFGQLAVRIDSLVSAQGTPPVARQIWDTVKNYTRQFRDATELSRYTGGAGPAKKTS